MVLFTFWFSEKYPHTLISFRHPPTWDEHYFIIKAYHSFIGYDSWSKDWCNDWFIVSFTRSLCPVSWGCRIHWLHLCRGVRPPPPNECPGYETKQSDGEVPAVLELWGMQSTPSLPSLPGPLWPRVVAPDRVLSMG